MRATSTPASDDAGATPTSIGLGIVVESLDAVYGSTAVLHAVDLSVAPGEMLALLGPSGCGKTTLLRCIAGLETPTAGRVLIGERDVTSGRGVPAERRRVGMVFQDGALFPHRSARRNVEYGVPRGHDRARRALDALRLVGLDAKADRMPGMLSGGEQQRVALARAVAPNPGVMLLDEPFSSLDAALRGHLRDDVRRLLRELGITGVLVTHDQEEALSFGDRVGVMRDGTIQQLGPPAEVYARPASPWVATFVGEATIVDADLDGSVAETPLGRVPLASTFTPGRGVAMARPEQIRLLAGSRGTVRTVDYRGASTRYSIDVGDLVVRVAEVGPPSHHAGDLVDVEIVDALHAWST